MPRTYWGREAGVSILKAVRPAFLRAVERGAVTLLTETEVIDLVQNDRDEVTGVVTRNDAGAERAYQGHNILLTTGGFGAGREFFHDVTGYPLFTWAWPFCRGTGALLAMNAGAQLLHQEYFVPRWSGVENPADPSRAERVTDTTSRRPPWEIYVTGAGERFVAEDVDEPLAREKSLLGVPDLTFWVVYDEAIRREAPPLFDAMPEEEVERWLGRHPSYCRADSLEALAEQAGIDCEGLLRTVAAYNDAVATGSDSLGRRHMPRALEEAPFYAIKHHGVAPTSVPGIAVNECFQVIREDGTPVGSLYAAGEILGMGLHSGNAFVGGMGLMPALTYGRMLGQSILPIERESEAAD